MAHLSTLLLLFLCISSGHPLLNKYSSQFSIGERGFPSPKYRSLIIIYANIPHIDYFSTQNTNIERYNIAILGAPFDTGTTARPGARFGPNGIRLGSGRINAVFGYDLHTHRNPLIEWAEIVDCGDAPLTYLDNTVALHDLEQSHKVISGRTIHSPNISQTPRIITLGGDYTTTLPALRSAKESLSDYAGYNHGIFLHWAYREGLILNSSVYVGSRGRISNPRDDLEYNRSCGFQIIPIRDIDSIRVGGVIEKIKYKVGGINVYISIDIDVLDPAFALATGTAEAGDWTTREVLGILRGLGGLRVIGADVVEVAPIYDNPGETTVLAAAEIILLLITLMVDTPVKN